MGSPSLVVDTRAVWLKLGTFHRVEIPQLALHNNKALAAALHAGDSGQPLQQWFELDHPDRLTFRLRERGWRLRTA